MTSKFKLMPVPDKLKEAIEDVEYYKKGGKVKGKSKQKQKQKQKQSIVVNIDNSRKTIRRKGDSKEQPRRPMFMPMPSINITPQQSGIDTLTLSKLLERLGQKDKVQEPEKLLVPPPSLEESSKIPESKEEKEDKEMPKDEEEPEIFEGDNAFEEPAFVLPASESYVPNLKGHEYIEKLPKDYAGPELKKFFANYKELFDDKGNFRKGTAATLARMYGIDTSKYKDSKILYGKIYKKIWAQELNPKD